MTRRREPLHKFDQTSLIVGATRYYIGRRTIAACFHAEELAAAWDQLSETTRTVIKRDLESAFAADDKSRKDGEKYHPLGMDCDRAAWEKVRNKYR